MAESLRKEAARRGVSLFTVRNERARLMDDGSPSGFSGYSQRERIRRQVPALISEGNRLACNQDPPADPRTGSRMCPGLNERVNPRDRPRFGDWRWRLWVAVEQLRRENKRERRAA